MQLTAMIQARDSIRRRQGEFIRSLGGIEESIVEQLQDSLYAERQKNMRLRMSIKEKSETIRCLIERLESENRTISLELRNTKGELGRERENTRRQAAMVEDQRKRISDLEIQLDNFLNGVIQEEPRKGLLVEATDRLQVIIEQHKKSGALLESQLAGGTV